MGRLKRWVATVFVASLSVVFASQSVFAVEGKSEVSRTEAQVAVASSDASRALMFVKEIVLDRHTPSLYRYWQRQDTNYKRTNLWSDDYCRSVTVRERSGYACDAPTWKHLSRGTVVAVPAGNVFVKVAQDAKAPETIALSPSKDSQLFALDTSFPAATKDAQTAKKLADNVHALTSIRIDAPLPTYVWTTIVFALIAYFFLLRYFREHAAVRERDQVIAAMSLRLDNFRKVAKEERAAKRSEVVQAHQALDEAGGAPPAPFIKVR